MKSGSSLSIKKNELNKDYPFINQNIKIRLKGSHDFLNIESDKYLNLIDEKKYLIKNRENNMQNEIEENDITYKQVPINYSKNFNIMKAYNTMNYDVYKNDEICLSGKNDFNNCLRYKNDEICLSGKNNFSNCLRYK